MKITVVGGPQDGRTIEVEDEVDYLSLPVMAGSMDGPLGLIPKFNVATLPIHHEEKKVYWHERY